MENKYFIKCNYWGCYAKGNICKCLDCKKGEVSVLCPKCGMTYIINSIMRRIDCSCDCGFIPCYKLCDFVNKELVGSPKA